MIVFDALSWARARLLLLALVPVTLTSLYHYRDDRVAPHFSLGQGKDTSSLTFRPENSRGLVNILEAIIG